MTEEKKDLTGLLQYSQALQESGQAPPVPEGAVMEEVPIEKIDSFESLEEYAIANPVPETPPESQPTDAPQTPPPAEPAPPLSDFSSSDFPTSTPQESEGAPPAEDPFANTPSLEPDSNLAPSPAPLNDTPIAALDFSTPAEPQAASPESFRPEPSQPEPSLMEAHPVTPPQSHPKNNDTPLEKIKKYSENLTVNKAAAVPASFPFSLLISGPLRPEEKEKLLELITRENMGFREIELEPQLAAGRILIPRISEYAGVLLVQALRGSRAQIKLGPSDTIFSTPETRTETEDPSVDESTFSVSTDTSHPAESIPVTQQEKLSHLPQFTVVDTLSASAALKSNVVEAETSSEYHEIVEALQRELKYKAYRRGAAGIVNFKVQLYPLSSPSHYRMLALGTAVKAALPQPPSPSPPSVETPPPLEAPEHPLEADPFSFSSS